MQYWSVYQLTVTLKSDLHIGHRPLGFVARTLPFVPAHIPWYALALTVVKKVGLPDRSDSFEQVELLLQKSVRFTPLFLYDPSQGLLQPWSDVGLDSIERYYLYSKYGVALDYSKRGALENRLYEKEVIAAHARQKTENTRLQGYVLLKPETGEGLVLDSAAQVNGHDIGRLISSSAWGGDISRGMGCLSNVELTKAENVFGCEDLDLEGPEPVVQWPADTEGPFYLEYDPQQQQEFLQGTIRPVCGRRFDPDKGPGLKFEKPFLARMPGWKSATGLKIGLGVKAAKSVNDIL